MHVIVGDEDFRELSTTIVSLLDVIDSGVAFDVNARHIIKTSDKLAIVIGEQKLSFNG
jgi:hypothetical protein